MRHTCPDGTSSKLTRTGPIGAVDGVAFTCPHCGMVKSGAEILADFERVRPLIVSALSSRGRGR